LKGEKLEAQICLQCGSMSWLMVSNSYVGEYRVRKDGHVEFNETFHELEYVCNECGGHSPLLGVKGTPKIYRELVSLDPMERVLKALNYVVDGTLEPTDDVDPDEVMELLECFRDRWTTLHSDEKNLRAAEDFMSKAKEVVGKWKLLMEP
jgi:hypothetical protein